MKEECLSSKLISIEQWNKIKLKAKIHFDSKTAKKIKYKFNQDFQTIFYNHGIDKNASISLKHLISIILYCDYSALCTKMSATFRKLTVSETEESVAKRNSKFYHFSKLLCETVNDFGIDGRVEKGPFYSGINCVLHMNSFAIIFYGPLSTSKQIEIAMNFSKSDGSIIQLQNDGFAIPLRFFDVSWISSFPDEDERVWINGDLLMGLRMVSIRIMRGSLNYKDWIHSLFVFDAMLSQQNIPTKIRKKDIRALKSLINGNHNGIHEYIINCFWLYCQKKTRIFVCTENNELLEDLVMATVPIEGTKYNAESKEWQTVNNVDQNDNATFTVPKPILIDLFPNLESIEMYPKQRFPLRSFLPFIECNKSNILYKIQVSKKWSNASKLNRLDNLRTFLAIDTEKYAVDFEDHDKFFIMKM